MKDLPHKIPEPVMLMIRRAVDQVYPKECQMGDDLIAYISTYFDAKLTSDDYPIQCQIWDLLEDLELGIRRVRMKIS